MIVLAGVTWKLCGPMHEMRGGMVWRNKCMTGWDYIGLYHEIVGLWVSWYGLIQVDGGIEVCKLLFYFVYLLYCLIFCDVNGVEDRIYIIF